MHADDHPIQAGPIKHDDSEAADRWYAYQTAKLTAAGYNWLGFTTHGATWRHPRRGDLYILHGVSNPADPSDGGIYSVVVHGKKGVSSIDTLGGPQDVTDDTLKNHPMWSQSDHDYFKGKGYEPNEIKDIWGRDHKAGKGPVTHDKPPDVVGSLTTGGFFPDPAANLRLGRLPFYGPGSST